jgi:hypothetical protein
MKNRLFFAVALNLSLAATAGAVKLSPSGIGEVIIVPYYTVQGGNSTLLSITNVSADVKAVKVRFLEAQNGRRVQSFNLYLPPNDVWTGNIQASGEGARVVTNDASCSEPVISAEGSTFFPGAYADDGGDTGLGRTREGFVEIIEMGVVTDQKIVDAVTFDQDTGLPADCDLVGGYWAKGGAWDVDPTAGMSGLTGGLMAEANIINVGDGVEYSQTLTVLEEFNDSADSLHSGPYYSYPSLDSASPAASTEPDDTWAKPEDAVSGLLMSESLYTVYTVNPGVDATTEWNVTFPTKRFYTDLDGDKKPFTSSFGADGACETVGIEYWNRETTSAAESNSLDLCYAANIVRVGASNIFQPEWSGVDFELADADYPNGWAEIDFVTLAPDAETPPTVDDYIDHIMESGGGSIYAGLPAIGFSASRLGNKNVGVGAAYAATAAHRYVRSMAHAQTDEACTGDSTCRVFELNIDVSDNYDGHIAPLTRHVYHFRSPTKESISAPFENRLIRFGVVDHGAEVSLNLGLSKVKGRTQPGNGEVAECFAGPGTELSLTMATDDKFTDCVMEFDSDYYFTIESLDANINGGYRFSFGKGGAY